MTAPDLPVATPHDLPHDLLAVTRGLRPAYAAVAWDTHPLGPPEGWSPTLRTAFDLVAGTAFPATLFWGPEFVCLYNEAFVTLIGDKHPSALGRPAREVFPEAWDEIGPMMRDIHEGGQARFNDRLLVPLDRSGFLEECYFTFSYSPVRDPLGAVEGVLNIAVDTTDRVLATRRLQVLARLQEAQPASADLPGLLARASEILRADAADLPSIEIRVDGESTARDPRLPAEPSPEATTATGPVRLQETPEGVVAWLPLDPSEAPGGDCVVVLLSSMLRPDAAYLDFLALLAVTLRQGIDRLRSRRAERELSYALQTSMLTGPTTHGGLDVAVRYVPAALLARVGGDWYDVFPLPSGDVSLVVGDVAGHDSDAAAIMGQLRNLLRAVAYLGSVSPAGVLGGLERSITGLALDAVATAVVGELSEVETGSPVFRWANAGHPPPVLLNADGTTELLERRAEMLLGIEDGVPRIDHVVRLPPGSTLVLYTDGLVERRGSHLDAGLTWLRETLAGCRGRTAEEICERLIEDAGGRHEDDIALVAVRIPG